MRKPIVSRFWCDPHLNVSAVSGDLPDKLDCEPSELLGTGWDRFVKKEDWPEIVRLSMDLEQGRVGQYAIQNVGRNGHRLYLTTRTFFVHHPDRPATIGGISLLDQWESPRASVVLKGAIK